MTKAIGYIRVSTDKQADNGHSLEDQQTRIRAYASLYDLDLVDMVVESGSGKNLRRDGLQDALKALEDGEAEALIVTSLDRLTRSVSDLGHLLEHYFQRFELLSVSEQIDTRSASGRLVLNVLGSVSQWQRERIGETTKQVMAHMRQQGQYTGGQVPYGYQMKDGKLLEVETEQKILSLVREFRAKGLSYAKISASLAKRGIVARTGKALHPQQIKRMAA